MKKKHPQITATSQLSIIKRLIDHELKLVLEQLDMGGMMPTPGAPPGGAGDMGGMPPGMPPDALGGLSEPDAGMGEPPEEKDPNKALLDRLKKKEEADIRKTLLSRLQGEKEDATLQFFAWVLDDTKSDETGDGGEESVDIPPKVTSVVRELMDQFDIDEDSLPEPEEPEEPEVQPAVATPTAPVAPPAPAQVPGTTPAIQEATRLFRKQEEGRAAQMKKKKPQISEEKLQRLVSLVVEKKILQLKEGKKFQAIRSLTIQAQQAAMKFEETMVDTLELIDPDELTDEEQRVYSQAMADMHSKVIEAVVHASEVLKNLSSKPPEPETPKKGKSQPEAQPVAPSVSKELPTLTLQGT